LGTIGGNGLQQKVGTSGLLRAASLIGLVALFHCGQTAEQRRGSIYDLRADPTEDHVRRIREYLSDPHPDVRATALNTLVGLRVPDSETLALDGLRDPDGFVRAIAAKRVGDLDRPELGDALVPVLMEDPDPQARRVAAESLERLGADPYVGALIRAMDDPIEGVRLAAVKAVRAADPSPARAALARLLLEDPSWEVRVQAAGALGQAGDVEMAPALEAALADEHELVRAAAANALDRLGRPVPRRVAPAEGTAATEPSGPSS